MLALLPVILSVTLRRVRPLPPRPAVLLSTFWMANLAGFAGLLPLNVGSSPALLRLATIWAVACMLFGFAIWAAWSWLALRFATSLPRADTSRASARVRLVRRLAAIVFPLIALAQVAGLVLGRDEALAQALGAGGALAVLGLIWVTAVGISEGLATPHRATIGDRIATALNLFLAPYLAVVLYNRLKMAAAADPSDGEAARQVEPAQARRFG